MAGPEVLMVRVEDAETGSSADYAFVLSPVRIGRSDRNDIAIAHPFASAWHGLVEFDAATVRYTDLGSTNGSSVDGIPAPARLPVTVPLGGAITIGTVRLTFPLRPGMPASPRERRTAAPTVVMPPVTPGRPPPGSITDLMKKLARAPSEDPEEAWKSVLYPGAVIGRFELVRELGRGGFGVVYEAKDRQLNRSVAFKAVRPGRNSQVTFRKQRLQLEAEAVAALTHPNIVNLFDVGSCDAGPYLIFELLRGETLHDRMKRGRLQAGEAIEVAIQIAWALDHAHAQGVVHRDLKPSNVFLCHGDLVKVLDFGISDVLGGGDLRGVGTPAYMAPEQWRGERQDARTDVFSAAVMLCEMVSGKLPYKVLRERSSVLDPGARPRVDATGVPAPVVDLIVAGASVDPARRPPGGRAWLDRLLTAQRDLEKSLSAGTPRWGLGGRKWWPWE